MSCNDEQLHDLPIFSLPCEIWEKIISFTNVEDIRSLENTCDFFAQFAKSPHVWKTQCLKSLYEKNVHFHESDIPNDLDFMSVHERISTTSFLFNTRSILTLPFNTLISDSTSIENLTTVVKTYMELKLRWSGETVNRDFINEIAFYKVCLESGMTYMFVFTPFQIKKIDTDVFRNHIRHSVPVIFTQNAVRCIVFIPAMLSLFVFYNTYLVAQIYGNNFIFAIVIDGIVREESYRHLTFPEGIQLFHAVRNKTIDSFINKIKEVLDLYTPEERKDCLLHFFVDYDNEKPEDGLLLDVVHSKLTKAYAVLVEVIQLNFTDFQLKFHIKCFVDILYDIVEKKRICPDNRFDPFKITVMDLREYILYGTDMI